MPIPFFRGGLASIGRRLLDEQRDGRFLPPVDGEVDGILPVLIQLHPLDGKDHIARCGRAAAFSESHPDFRLEGRNNLTAVLIDHVDLERVGSFFNLGESEAERDGTLRMDGGHCPCPYCVECAQKVQLSTVVRCRVTDHKYFKFHIVALAGGATSAPTCALHADANPWRL